MQSYEVGLGASSLWTGIEAACLMPHIQCCAEPGQGIQSYQTNTMDSQEAELLLSPTSMSCLISGGSLTIPGQNSQHVDIHDGQCNDITSGDLVKREVLVSFFSSSPSPYRDWSHSIRSLQ